MIILINNNHYSNCYFTNENDFSKLVSLVIIFIIILPVKMNNLINIFHCFINQNDF